MWCVSKSWLDLISSPDFVKTHLSLSANNKEYTHHRLMLSSSRAEYHFKHCYLSSLIYESVTRVCDFDNPMRKPRKTVEIVGSVNGLICLIIGEQDLFIWNTSIRKFKKLPDSTATLMCGYYLMFGFGYDEFHDDYKVVAIFRNMFVDSLYFTEVNIYSLKSDSWTSIHVSRSGVLLSRCGKFVNGKLHWITKTAHGWDIICIDLADGKWGKVEQPCYGEGKLNFRLSLGVLGGDLSLFCYYQRMTTHVDLWIMKKYGVKESWTKMFNINHPADLVRFLFYPPFCMSNKGEFLFQFVSTFMVYNPKDESLRYLEVTNCDTSFEASVYIESLVWPIFPKGSKDAIITKA
ncbi:PREDICTED: F-box/kelch-repeat protein At3g23880-like [Nicotiana attenuata]|nr:PREDICTED: F-box/kelch-repeat protein At3g23880-like [Nicotiana attenuata]